MISRPKRDARYFLGVLLVVIGIGAGVACGDSEGDPTATPSTAGTASATGTTQITVTPSATTGVGTPSPTGEPGFVTTIRSVEAGETAALLDRVVMSGVACGNDAWPLPTCDGQPEGTVIQRLPFVGCEPSFMGIGEVETLLRQTLAGREPRLHAAVTMDGQEGQVYPLGPYAAVFRTNPPQGVDHDTGLLVVMDENGSIISLRTHCRATPEQLAEAVSAGESVDVPGTE